MKANKEQKTFSANEAKNAYLRAWRAKNREKVKEYNRRYWLRVAEKLEQGASENKGASSNDGGNEVNQ